MPFISSPVAYPPSSSPQVTSPRKRKRPSHESRSPLRPKPLKQNHSNRPFHEDSDSDASADEVVNQQKADRINDNGKENACREPARAADPTSTGTSPISDRVLGDSILARTLSGGDGSTVATGTSPTRALATVTLTTSNRSDGLRLGQDTTNPGIRSTSGKTFNLIKRTKKNSETYEQIIAARSVTTEGRARRSYYGIDINSMLETAEAETTIVESQRVSAPLVQSIEPSKAPASKTLMWTEKYRARKFTDLVGDDRTHRTVMHWLKAWDQIVFPGAVKRKHISKNRPQPEQEPRQHRKILLLTGPPGLGKTTLAHVCAKQAGYEVSEINASDDRSRDVVKGRIRDMLGTENVKTGSTTASGAKKIAKPICVIVDEVDGVVSGSSGGEGGFMKALIDLVLLDQRNTKNAVGQQGPVPTSKTKRKGDNFRMMRPLIMICNDAYHASLRPLRSSNLVEIIHCGRPALNTVANRVKSIFEREGIGADGDAVRRLCEGCWGTMSKKEGGAGAGAGEGDIRSVLVMSEWIAARIRSASLDDAPRLTKKWLETNMADPSANGAVRGLGRGGSREIVDRVFMEGAGLSRPTTMTSTFSAPVTLTTSVKSVNEALKAASSSHLRTLIDGHGESDRIMTDLFSQYPTQPFQDDNFLSKPRHAYEWLNFHDRLSSAVYSLSEWELAPYLSTPALGFHHLFAASSATRARYSSSSHNPNKTYSNNPSGPRGEEEEEEEEVHPFLTPSAPFAATERTKSNAALLQSLYENLTPDLTRLYPRPEHLALDFAPYLLRMLSPAVNPVLITSSVGGSGKGDNRTTASVRKASERLLVERATRAMLATGVRFERNRVDGFEAGVGQGKVAGGWVYRMEPALDSFGMFETGGKGFGDDVAGGSAAGNRYGVRQVLVQECTAEVRRVEGEKRGRRGGKVDPETVEETTEKEVVKKGRGQKRDFFGRVMKEVEPKGEVEIQKEKMRRDREEGREGRTWVSFHEGYSNAVRKPITLAELMRGL
ncbi:hypothetical protein CAC42_5005 [Sphaceloma murrayae]|uniref:AAA+ ATPase domain-containing protein n=1 Tax=Sphaceloma murrayae TaxID=2082308 RepID=A0A2K1QPU1_9PEZI|nr:hypothetical protein CAC42_5005 [Sphaceloma murrayae]